ncbi:hypothetical protein NQ314_005715 [Rhamnusium bicolor]|uniref:DDE Tnp4 domain-containing protein n=1 Tax=Rhamnusium bicolor TaxID=1586634 RepID=A0AAV8ZGA4_9CUCU|nr:hypothetical protein NQ314_005715 [Rhamnusium bicolor]
MLSDSGYPQQPWLMTPFLNAAPNTPEAAYTETHIRGRNCAERLNGIFKARFHCIMGERNLRYDPDKVGHIINACAILHNICVAMILKLKFKMMILYGEPGVTSY